MAVLDPLVLSSLTWRIISVYPLFSPGPSFFSSRTHVFYPAQCAFPLEVNGSGWRRDFLGRTIFS